MNFRKSNYLGQWVTVCESLSQAVIDTYSLKFLRLWNSGFSSFVDKILWIAVQG